MNNCELDHLPRHLCVDDFMKTVTDARTLATAFDMGVIDLVLATPGIPFETLLDQTGGDREGLALLLMLLQSAAVLEEDKNCFTLAPRFMHALEYRDLMKAKLDFANFAVHDFVDLFSLLVKNPGEFMQRSDMFRLFCYGRCFEQTAGNYAITRQWMRFTTALTKYEAGVCMDKHDFGTCRTVLDIGGNSGELALRLCKRHQNIAASVFDLPLVCDIGEEHVSAEPEAGRIAFVRGDIRTDKLPAGFDLAVFKSMLHDWPDNMAREFISKAAGSILPGGTLLIFERGPFDSTVLPLPYSLIPFLLFFNVFRKPDRYVDWLENAGFQNVSVIKIQLEMPFYMISGVKAGS